MGCDDGLREGKGKGRSALQIPERESSGTLGQNMKIQKKFMSLSWLFWRNLH